MNDFMSKETLHKLHLTELEILDEFVRICDKNNLKYFLYGGTLLGAKRHKGFIPWDDDLDIAMPRNDYELFLEIAPKELNKKYIIDNYKTNKLYYLNFSKIRNVNTRFVQDFEAGKYKGPQGIWIDIFPLDYFKKEKSFIQDLKIKIVKLLRSVAHYRSGFFLGNKKIIFKKILGGIFKIVPLNFIIKIQDSLMKNKVNVDSEYFINIASQYNYRKQTMKKEVFFPGKYLEFEGKMYSVPENYEYFLERIYGDYMKLPPKDKRRTHNPVELNFEEDAKK